MTDYSGFRFTGRNATPIRPTDSPQAEEGDVWARDRTTPGADNGTELDATWLNRVKANLENFVVGCGGNPAAGDDQLLGAVQAILNGYATIALLGDRVEVGSALTSLSDGDGFVRMTDAERTKLASLPTNYKGSFANMAALEAAHAVGAAGDWAILMNGVDPATVAMWDTDSTAWVDTDAAPATLDWASVTGKPSDITNITSLLAAKVATTRTVSTSGLAAGGGDLSADRTIDVPKGAAADVRGGTNDSKALTIKAIYDGLAEVNLTQASTIAVDLATGLNFETTMTDNRILGNPSNGVPGQSGRIRIVQDGTGSRTLAYASNWHFEGDVAPTLSTSISAIDYLDYEVISSSIVRAKLSKGWA
ncbi:MAG: hypothetical protein AB7S70_00645 [Hyphomicrobium sp.]|uniref:hypothetical protein n=1 Tax=Hyphomicrobium sp. TaxID=82 RepID=UPI003D0BC6EE